MVKKLVPVIVCSLALGGVYKFVLAKPPAKAEPKPKSTARSTCSRRSSSSTSPTGASRSSRSGSSSPTTTPRRCPPAAATAPRRPRPRATAPWRQEGVVRDVITDVLTDAHDKELIEGKGREHLKEEILKDLKKHTDVKVEHVLFSDLTVQ